MHCNQLEIDEDVVRGAAGLARKTYLFELSNCVINKNTAKALEIVDRLYGESRIWQGFAMNCFRISERLCS